MRDLILAIDQGTTSSRAMLFSPGSEVVASAQYEFTQYFPQDGWVEHDPEEIWRTTERACQDVIKRVGSDATSIAGIGITNQRETTVVWDRETSKPVYPAIVWQDRRTADRCEQLKAQKHETMVAEKTGLLLDPYFSATKLAWILEHVDGARKKAAEGKLLFGTIDSYLLWRLSDGRIHRTDASNASRTLLFNIHTQQWDDDLLELFGVPVEMLPQVCDSSADFGVTAPSLFGARIAVGGIAGDQQAALVGQGCFLPGMAKSTYGTGCFVMLNTGGEALSSTNRLLTTVAYRLAGKVTYAIEGSIFNAGTAVQWLRDGLGLINDASESEAIAVSTVDANGVYLVPAFTGLGAPYWDPDARGAVLGLTRGSSRDHLVVAALQSVVYQTRDLFEAMKDDGLAPTALHVDGGMAVNNWLMQFLADMLNLDIVRPRVTETTALGAAYLAGLQQGLYGTTEDIFLLSQQEEQQDREFQAAMPERERQRLYNGWLEAVNRVRSQG